MPTTLQPTILHVCPTHGPLDATTVKNGYCLHLGHDTGELVETTPVEYVTAQTLETERRARRNAEQETERWKDMYLNTRIEATAETTRANHHAALNTHTTQVETQAREALHFLTGIYGLNEHQDQQRKTLIRGLRQAIT